MRTPEEEVPAKIFRIRIERCWTACENEAQATWQERRRTGALETRKKDETSMKLTKNKWLRCAGKQMRQNPVVVILLWIGLLGTTPVQFARAQALSTTTVQGTVYLANGQPGSGTLHVSWPAFTTANGLAVAADSATVPIGRDGFLSVNLAPNLGATPAGLFYTVVFYMSDGTTSTQYRRRDTAELFGIFNSVVH
jgi:hypothetical protein